MKETIVTGWSTAGWHEYAKQITSTWRQNIPDNIDLIAYVDDDFDDEAPDFKIHKLSLIPGYNFFIDKYIDIPKFNGRKPGRPGNSPKEYDYRWDAIKWARQAYIPWDCSQVVETDYLYWFDADVEFTKKLPEGYMTSLFGVTDSVIYFGRDNLHSDIGFIGFRKDFKEFLTWWKEVYESRDFIKVREWHSAFTFDYIIKRWNMLHSSKNLTKGKPLGREKSIWEQSPLNPYCYHLKGMWKFKDKGAKNDQKERL